MEDVDRRENDVPTHGHRRRKKEREKGRKKTFAFPSLEVATVGKKTRERAARRTRGGKKSNIVTLT